MKFFLAIIVLAPVSIICGEGDKTDPWKPLRPLVGEWVLEQPGKVSITKTFEWMYGETFLKMTTRSEFAPSDEKPKGEIHEEIGFFSYDRARKCIVLRVFYSEGFVNSFILKSELASEGELFFQAEAFENAPQGTRARLEFSKNGPGMMKQAFHVAWPNRDYSCFLSIG